jgi:uncharacterized protein Smg (DUF494 family)
MKQSLTKLVDVILKHIEEQPETFSNETGIRNWLAGQGYKKRDIDAALKLVSRRLLPPPVVRETPRRALRALSVHEEFKLSPDAKAALARLEILNLIDPIEREMILDRLGHFDGEVGLDELDYLLSWVVCGGRDVESQQTILGTLDTETDTYH